MSTRPSVKIEHAMFFGYGTGGNGKSVLIDAIAGIMGNYHMTAPIETFTASADNVVLPTPPFVLTTAIVIIAIPSVFLGVE
jgi:phage/plasmid-associated DNA primase